MIYTIGYEGLSAETFWNRMREHGIEVLVDVRAVPWSRKPGFSKGALAARCEEEGIKYLHMVALGCPRAIRDFYKADADWDAYTRRFVKHLSSGEASVEDALESLREMVTAQRCALMCFEADAYRCHRSLVADELSARLRLEDPRADGSIEHIGQAALEAAGR